MALGVDVQARFIEPLNRLNLNDLRRFSDYLEATDPDPTSKADNFNYNEKIEYFRSIVQLVPNPNKGLAHTAKRLGENGIALLADNWMGQFTEASSETLIALLDTLEARAFRYDPVTKKVTIADEKALLQFQNTIKAIERSAYKERAFLEMVDQPNSDLRKKIYRASILASPDLTGEGRGFIYQIERESMTIRGFNESHRPFTIKYIQTYDGAMLPMETREYKMDQLLGEFARLYWSEEMILSEGQRHGEAHREEDKRLYASRGVPIEKLKALPEMSETQLIMEASSAYQAVLHAATPEERVPLAIWWRALIDETVVRGKSEKWWEGKVSETVLKPLEIFRDIVGDAILDQIREPFIVSVRAAMTKSRLDNYRGRDTFLSAARVTMQMQLERMGMNFRAVQNDPLFNNFLGLFISLATNFKIPFDADCLVDFASQAGVGAVTVVGQRPETPVLPMIWEGVLDKVRKGEKVTVALDQYPSQPDPWESELELTKKIFYKGKTLYEMIQFAINTVTFVPLREYQGTHFSGMARALLQDVELAPLDHTGRPVPVYKRLSTLGHELFHNLQGYRNLSGYPITLLVFQERGAYFFDAFLLERYLAIRAQAATNLEKPLKMEEARAIVNEIVTRRMNGFAANRKIRNLDPSFDVHNDDIEIPLKDQVAFSVDHLAAIQEQPENSLYYTPDLPLQEDSYLLEKYIPIIVNLGRMNERKGSFVLHAVREGNLDVLNPTLLEIIRTLHYELELSRLVKVVPGLADWFRQQRPSGQ